MHRTQSDFKVPPHTHTSDGKPRLVGYELEFSGLSLDQATDALRDSLKAEIVSETGAQRICHAAGLGEFTVELDWDFIKRKAKETSEAEKDDNWIEKVGEVAAILVPIEMVCPPVPVTSMNALDPMVHALRDAGAVGTEESSHGIAMISRRRSNRQPNAGSSGSNGIPNIFSIYHLSLRCSDGL